MCDTLITDHIHLMMKSKLPQPIYRWKKLRSHITCSLLDECVNEENLTSPIHERVTLSCGWRGLTLFRWHYFTKTKLKDITLEQYNNNHCLQKHCVSKVHLKTLKWYNSLQKSKIQMEYTWKLRWLENLTDLCCYCRSVEINVRTPTAAWDSWYVSINGYINFFFLFIRLPPEFQTRR